MKSLLAVILCTTSAFAAEQVRSRPDVVPRTMLPDGRCGTVAPPRDLMLAIERQTEEILARLESESPRTRLRTESITYPSTVKVNFHVIRGSFGEGDVSDATLDAQISVLNSSFSGRGFQFVRNSVDRTNNGNCHRLRYNTTQETDCKSAYTSNIANNPDAVLNFYIADARDTADSLENPVLVLGWATFPAALANARLLDGVVVHYGTLPGGYWSPYNLGDTAVHEVGHWLGLYHTFEGGCTPPGDSVEDTPYELLRYDCTNRDTCPQTGLDPVTNFMNYTDDSCMFEFTGGQADRMVSQELAYRPALHQAKLSGSGASLGGRKFIDLTWKGLTTPTVDIFRDGVKVMAGSPNDGIQSHIFYGSNASYNYWVCNANSTTHYNYSTCTNVQQINTY